MSASGPQTNATDRSDQPSNWQTAAVLGGIALGAALRVWGARRSKTKADTEAPRLTAAGVAAQPMPSPQVPAESSPVAAPDAPQGSTAGASYMMPPQWNCDMPQWLTREPPEDETPDQKHRRMAREDQYFRAGMADAASRWRVHLS